MSVSRTLSILKPDATRRRLTGVINAQIEASGFSIIAQKRLMLSLSQAQAFYHVHAQRPFFGQLCQIMSSGPVIVQVLQRDDAVVTYRQIMGATNPQEADEGTIRRIYGLSIDENTVHGSDSEKTAAEEIGFFFSGIEILP